MNIRGNIIISICVCSLFLSCKTIVIEEEGDYYQSLHGFSQKTLLPLSQSDKNCIRENAAKEIGVIPIRVIGEKTNEKLDFDFRGVSGIGLQNEETKGVYTNYSWSGNYDDCRFLNNEKSKFYCKYNSASVLNAGSPVLFCTIPQDGYPLRSVENFALVNMAAYLKTVRLYNNVTDREPSRKIGILLFPEITRNITMKDGEKINFKDFDNARWVNRVHAGGWTAAIEILPTSWQYYYSIRSTKEMGLQMGVMSHEVGHHLFASRVLKLKRARSTAEDELTQELSPDDDPTLYSYVKSNINRTFGLENAISAIDEAYADLVSHFTFNSSKSPYYSFSLDLTTASRRVDADNIDIGNSTLYNLQEKALTEPVLRHFFSSKVSYAAPENSYSPDHQDQHAIGAIIANALDRLFGSKLDQTADRPKVEEKYKLLNAWVDRVEDLYLRKIDYYKNVPAYSSEKGSAVHYEGGPASFLRDAMWEMVQLAFVEKDTLKREQCKILKKKFPVYVVNWSGKYQCLQ